MSDAPAKKVLVIEDDNTTRLVLVKRLQSLGFEVFAPSPDENFHKEVLSIAREQPLQVVICDLTLPDLGGQQTKVQGLEFIRELSKIRKEKRFSIVANSGTVDPKSIEWVKRMGVQAVFFKSQQDSLEQLLKTVEELANAPMEAFTPSGTYKRPTSF